MVRIGVLLLAGGLAAQHTTLLSGSDWLSVLLVASIGGLVLRTTRTPAIVVLGFVLFQMAGQFVIGQRLDSRFEGDSMLAVVRVADFPQVREESVSMALEPLGDPRLPPRFRVTWAEPPVTPVIGEVWELELRLRRPRGNANPGVFDIETWLFREQVHATGYVVGGKRNRLLWAGAVTRVDAFRRRFLMRARAATDSRDAAAVIAAVAVGARHEVSREQWDRFAITGTSHLMAISGLHVGLAATAAFAVAWCLAGALSGNRSHLAAALLGGVSVAFAYTAISGFGVPAQRATIMLAATAIAVVRRRQPDPGAALALAGVVVFISSPIVSLTPGFHLSFAAVVLLLWLARRGPMRATGLAAAPRQLAVIQVFLMFGLAPLTALIFRRFAVLAMPVNLVAVPLFSLVIAPLALAGMALGDVADALARPLLELAALAIDGLDALLRVVATVPLADGHLARIDGAARVLLLLPLAWILLPRGWPGRGIATIGVVALLLWRPAPPPADCFDTWVLDVGQGLAVVVQTHDDVMLYDTGMAWRNGGSMAEQVVAPFLRSRGVKRIERLLVSHGDLDHSGGVEYVRQVLNPRFVITGEALEAVPAWPCVAGRGWWSGAVRFAILHPDRGSMQTGNDASCVLRVSVGAHSLLLTGDIEIVAERQLLAREPLSGADVVVVPHHGSKTSSSAPFVDAVRPAVAIVSAAYGNRWGFPRPRVTARWEDAGAVMLNTAQDGAVHTRICAAQGVVALAREREHRRRFWHAE